MLHYPFNRFTNFLSFDKCDYKSYTDAFYTCRCLHLHPDNFYTDVVANDQDAESKDESVCNEINNKPLANFKAFACQQPNNNDLTYSFTDDLGSYDLDYTYD
jgi:hypothetical protein